MSSLSPAELKSARNLVRLALDEDLGDVGDLTSQATIPHELQGSARFIARADGVLAGWPLVGLVEEALDAGVVVKASKNDGDRLQTGDFIGELSGPMRGILTLERTALNFLQHLSGVASMTRRYVDVIAGLPGKILDTRKTLPGWRLLEKYAVRCGGGQNHRMGLCDGILIKDNHLAALATQGEPIPAAVAQARHFVSDRFPVEIEVDSLEQLDVALGCGPGIVLLDNMPPEMLREAVKRRDERAPHVRLEASGGINLQTVRAIAESGVERISVGALTHSAPALDIALDYSAP